MKLVEKTLFGIIDKVQIAIDFLQEHEPSEGYYLAYSGGKDSTVLLDLARRSGVKFEAYYNHTNIDPPELIRFVYQQEGVKIVYPKTSIWDLIIKNGFPYTRFRRYCCRELKRIHGRGRVILTGIRRDESPARTERPQIEELKDMILIKPIFHWTEGNVWNYIHSNNLPYCSLYDEGRTRLGCICCPMQRSAGMLRDAERWPKYKEHFIRVFQRVVDRRIEKGDVSMKWRTGEDVWETWTSDCKYFRDNPGQEFLWTIEDIDVI